MPYIDLVAQQERIIDSCMKQLNSHYGETELFKIQEDVEYIVKKLMQYGIDNTVIERFTCHIMIYKNRWIRKLDEWKIDTKSVNYSLFSHLFCNYFLEDTILDFMLHCNSLQFEWFIHIGQGGSIRTAPNFPIAYTKKMAHSFMHLDGFIFTVKEAIYAGFAYGVGCTKHQVYQIVETSIINDYKQNAFWEKVLIFFANNPDYPLHHVKPTIDFIQAHIENFSIKGRKQKSLLNLVDQWHQELSQKEVLLNVSWQPSVINAYEDKKWTIKEITTKSELYQEGKKMQHCVGSYFDRCVQGDSNIWSFHSHENTLPKESLTIEVKDKIILQIRGKNNRRATRKEMTVIKKWARREDLEIRDFFYHDRPCQISNACYYFQALLGYTLMFLPGIIYLLYNASTVGIELMTTLMHLFFMYVINIPLSYRFGRRIVLNFSMRDRRVWFLKKVIPQTLLPEYLFAVAFMYFLHNVYGGGSEEDIYNYILIWGYSFTWLLFGGGIGILFIWEHTKLPRNALHNFLQKMEWRDQLW